MLLFLTLLEKFLTTKGTIETLLAQEKTNTLKNEISVKRSQKFRKLARASSFVYPESAVSSARAWRYSSFLEVGIAEIMFSVRVRGSIMTSKDAVWLETVIFAVPSNWTMLVK